MKTLTLIRHAKSDWSDLSLSDFDRPLNKRGYKNAPMMGRILSQSTQHPDLILSSPALRAKTTAELIARELHYPIQTIRYDETLYDADPHTIIASLRQVPDTVEHLFLIAHNPGLSEAAEYLCGFAIGDIPTCGIVMMKLKSDSWKSADGECAVFVSLDYPKKHH